MNLLVLNICISFLIIAVLLVKKYGKNRIAVNFYWVLWEIIVIKLLLSIVVPILKVMIDFILNSGGTATEYISLGVFENLNVIVLCVWLGISFGLLLLFVIKYCLFIKKMRAASPLDSSALKIDLIKESNHDIKLKKVDDLQSPVTLGILKPTVIIPGFVLEMTEKEQEYLLYHEMCHAKHRDTVWKILAISMAAIYWFNPFIWFLVIHMEQDLELRCDYNVLSKLGGNVKYAELLLNFAKHSKNPVYLLNGFSESTVKKRIIFILGFKKEQKKRFFSIVFSLLFACLVVAIRMDFIASIAEVIMGVEATENSDIQSERSLR